ncbi:serine hydrolase [Paenarthrobacter nitroguajacolicus]|uniref:Serine hydrolase n=1 Tax=Paenarthrobacter nitroguajacolicus TaxID=211146 RepID=A0A558GVI4_PAENT|nr:serine hydrolase [Paenarthrobacter nitroguajacolicus]TVU60895.1 serine hydrolase [Paenarthrobacter nitroguajacolicus]
MSMGSEELAEIFAAVGATGYVHAREVGVVGGREVSLNPDEAVVLASVFKVPFAVAYSREVSAGRLKESDRTTVTSRYRVGGLGTAGCADDVEMSWRDLAKFMMTMSDNAATDVIFHRIGQAAVDAVLDDLGLQRTRIIGCGEDMDHQMAADLGLDPSAATTDMEAMLAAAAPEQVWALGIMDPARTPSSTPRDIVSLLDAIWTNSAGSPETCERVRSMMEQQIWRHRMATGFDDGVVVAGKTGTLPAIRNEVGVVTYPDGRRYAVAVFTRATTLSDTQPGIDASIGKAARLAVDLLRGA